MGPLPIVNHFLQRLGMPSLLDKYVPTTDSRCTIPYAKALGVLLRSIIVEREPIYRQQEMVDTYCPQAFGITTAQAERLRDDAIGRALDKLFTSDRSALLTEVIVGATKRFDLRLDELHNDSTSIRLTGQYRQATGRSIRGRRAPWIRYGFSKDHRPDLKQLLLILTTTSDGGVPIQFRCADGNTNDSTTHLDTWASLKQAAGRADFLYVADSKLCTAENMHMIHSAGGRFVTVLPRSRKEDRHFREWIQTHQPEWEKVWDRPNPRGKYGPRDRWYVYQSTSPSREGWPVIWVYSTLLTLHQRRRRQERLARAIEELTEEDRRLQGPRPRRRSRQTIQERVDEILESCRVARYLHVEPWQEAVEQFRQERRGRPGTRTRYIRKTRHRWRLRWHVRQDVVAYDEKSDGMYPLLTNDRTLIPAQVLEAHKRQPTVEKRFQQAKTVHEIAPVFLKNEGRIEALFFLYFLALLIQGLIEREIRRRMDAEGIDQLPLYPEDRRCPHPTTQQVLRLFGLAARHVLTKGGRVIEIFDPELTDTQHQTLKLLAVPVTAFRSPPDP